MKIKRKIKQNFVVSEFVSQKSFFGYDNLSFKTVNLPKPQRFKNLSYKFNLKKIVKKDSALLNYIKI